MTELTEEQKQRLAAIGHNVTDSPVYERGWSTEQIKEAFAAQGFTLASFAKAVDVKPGDVYQSLQKRSPKIDKIIAAFLGVHESTIWPNRYFKNGVAIHKTYAIETRTDEELEKLNEQFLNPPKRTIVESWVGGSDGGPIVRENKLRETAIPSMDETFEKDEAGRFVIPLGDGIDYPDVSPMADEKNEVTLPEGMKL